MSPRRYTGPARSRLEGVMQRHGVSQTDLAAALGVGQPTVQRIAAGHQDMTLPRARRVLAALASLGVDATLQEL